MNGNKCLFGALFALVMMVGLLMMTPQTATAQGRWWGTTDYEGFSNWPSSPVTHDNIDFKVDFWWYPNTDGYIDTSISGEGTLAVTSVDIQYYNSGTLLNTVTGASVGYATGSVYLRDTNPNSGYTGNTLLTDTGSGKTDTMAVVTIDYSNGISSWVSREWYGHYWNYATLTYHYNWTTQITYNPSPLGGTSASYNSGDLTYVCNVDVGD